MKIGNFRIGMRTLKTGIAVFICMVLFYLTHRGNPMIAALSATFSLREDFKASLSFGKKRVIGNAIGGTLAIVYFLVNSFFHSFFLIQIVFLPILVILAISFSDFVKNNAGIVACIATLLMISLTIPQHETFLYALARVFDTFIGMVIAISLNIFVHPKLEDEKIEIDKNLLLLRQKEQELEELREKVQEQLQKR